MNDQQQLLVSELEKLLNGGTAHVGLSDAIAGLPKNLRGVQPHNLPYSVWQLVEHIRIAQWDMLQFSKNIKHQSPDWPEGFWPKEAEPADEETWNNSVAQIKNDLQEFINLVKSENLYQKIPGGDGQTILREALQIADHNAYHVAEIIILRRLMNAWK
ncbi:DinB family protein [Pedobacter antarcticus]|uniref:DinB family protein n=1 Tax=Pedobacter antarcticus TaxID=34086 RepID=UPI00292D3006|nr:DinB family protein [Pedobacter antarcticus]